MREQAQGGTAGSEAGLFNGLLKASLGAGIVLVGAYVVSKLREKRELEKRVAELEKQVSELEEEKVVARG